MSETTKSQPASSSPGTPFGKYLLHEQLGAGGMAEVFRATLSTVDGFEKTLVIKRIRPDRMRKSRFRKLFVEEARLVSRLIHPNIVQVHELGCVQDEHYIAMEWVDGWDLHTVLGRASRSKRPVPIGVALHIATQVCAALDYAHHTVGEDGKPISLVHHDVSPSNVLIARHGGVKLADFGLAALGDSPGDPGPKRLRGKVSYMPPELVAHGMMDHRGDLFAVGVILYEMLTLKRLLRGKDVEQTLRNVANLDVEARLANHDHIPQRVKQVLAHALAIDPDMRYPAAELLAEDLEDLRFELGLRVSDRDVAAFVGVVCGGAVRMPRTPGFESSWSTRFGSASATSGTRFVFRPGGGTEVGPLRRDTMERMVAAHAVAPTDPVSVNGGEFVEAAKAPALADAMAVAWSTPKCEPQQTGPFGWSCAVALLTRLAQRGETGRLELSNGEVRKAAWLMKGRIVAVESNRPDELLGVRLVEAGAISRVQLEAALAEASSGDMALGGALLKLGLLRIDELSSVLEAQMTTRLGRAVVWDRGEFAWYAGEERPPAMTMGRVHPLPVAAEAICELVEYERIEAWLAAAGDLKLRRVKSPGLDVEQLRLRGPIYRHMATLQLDGRTLAEVLAPQAGEVGRDAAARAVFLMLQTGLAQRVR